VSSLKEEISAEPVLSSDNFSSELSLSSPALSVSFLFFKKGSLALRSLMILSSIKTPFLKAT
jgi:hypothetical protein